MDLVFEDAAGQDNISRFDKKKKNERNNLRFFLFIFFLFSCEKREGFMMNTRFLKTKLGIQIVLKNLHFSLRIQ